MEADVCACVDLVFRLSLHRNLDGVTPSSDDAESVRHRILSESTTVKGLKRGTENQHKSTRELAFSRLLPLSLARALLRLTMSRSRSALFGDRSVLITQNDLFSKMVDASTPMFDTSVG
jgi:hypothetical protein